MVTNDHVLWLDALTLASSMAFSPFFPFSLPGRREGRHGGVQTRAHLPSRAFPVRNAYSYDVAWNRPGSRLPKLTSRAAGPHKQGRSRFDGRSRAEGASLTVAVAVGSHFLDVAPDASPDLDVLVPPVLPWPACHGLYSDMTVQTINVEYGKSSAMLTSTIHARAAYVVLGHLAAVALNRVPTLVLTTSVARTQLRHKARGRCSQMHAEGACVREDDRGSQLWGTAPLVGCLGGHGHGPWQWYLYNWMGMKLNFQHRISLHVALMLLIMAGATNQQHAPCRRW